MLRIIAHSRRPRTAQLLTGIILYFQYLTLDFDESLAISGYAVNTLYLFLQKHQFKQW